MVQLSQSGNEIGVAMIEEIAASIRDRVIKTGGATVAMQGTKVGKLWVPKLAPTGPEAPEGWAVGMGDQPLMIPLTKFTPEACKALVAHIMKMEHGEKVSDPFLHFGLWVKGPVVVCEMVQVFGDVEVAKELGVSRRQEAIYDMRAEMVMPCV